MSVKQQVGVGCLMVVAAAVTAVLAVTLGGIQGFGGQTSFQAPITDAAGLTDGALVAVRGVEVGRVTALSLDGGAATVHFEVYDDVVLREGARAHVRARSLLGEKYLALELGDGEPLSEGATLGPVTEQFEVDELVAVLTPLLEAVDPEALRQASSALARTLKDDPELLARMLADAELVLRRSAVASEELEPLLRDTRAAVGDARSTLAVLEARGREAEALIQRADRLVTELDAAADPLPETVEEARAALAEARALIVSLEGAVNDAEATMQMLDREGLREIMLDDGVRVRLFGNGPGR